MVVRRCGTHLKVHAPAKLNLHLEILARRTDGFHEIETLMLSLSLYDTLVFQPHPSDLLDVHCWWTTGLASRFGATLGDLPQGEDNLVHRALALLRERAAVRHGGRMQIWKRIPSQAGLGGASSDAAAALLVANVGWDVNWPREQLAELAAELGSDVPFFLTGGAAICRGRGERIESLGRVPPLHVVVARPATGLSTPAVYKACRVPEVPTKIEDIATSVQRGNATRVATTLVNRLQEPVERLSSDVVRLREAFNRSGCLGSQMSGSGSSYFGICRTSTQARQVAARLRAENVGLVASGIAGAA